MLTLAYDRGEVQKRLRSRQSRCAGFSSRNFDILIVSFPFLAAVIEMMPPYRPNSPRNRTGEKIP